MIEDATKSGKNFQRNIVMCDISKFHALLTLPYTPDLARNEIKSVKL